MIEESLRLGTLPNRTCQNPGSWQARGCAFRTKCFLGWVSEDMPLEVVEDELPSDADDVLQSLMSLGLELKDAKRHIASLEGIRDHMRTKLDLPIGRWIKFGDGCEVRLSSVKGQETLNMSRAREAGWDVPPELQEFVNQGKGHIRWTFRQR
jgi:hypothetical protein